MIESVSRRFLEMVDPQRDSLYALAQSAGGGSAKAELILQRAVRQAYRAYAAGTCTDEHLGARLAQLIQEAGPAPQSAADRSAARSNTEALEKSPHAPDSAGGVAAPATASAAMPADTWARLAAAVQIEAARLGGAAEQSMLAYDPLLAPQKRSAPGEDPMEGLNLSPWSRFVIGTAIVLIIGIVATIMLTSHARREPALGPGPPAAAATHPAPSAAAAKPKAMKIR